MSAKEHAHTHTHAHAHAHSHTHQHTNKQTQTCVNFKTHWHTNAQHMLRPNKCVCVHTLSLFHVRSLTYRHTLPLTLCVSHANSHTCTPSHTYIRTDAPTLQVADARPDAKPLRSPSPTFVRSREISGLLLGCSALFLGRIPLVGIVIDSAYDRLIHVLVKGHTHTQTRIDNGSVVEGG